MPLLGCAVKEVANQLTALTRILFRSFYWKGIPTKQIRDGLHVGGVLIHAPILASGKMGVVHRFGVAISFPIGILSI